VEPQWALADLDTLRHVVFVGHEGMPTFGDGGISAREVDGAAFYILHLLRPDVLPGGS
jgi:hypothetical protein